MDFATRMQFTIVSRNHHVVVKNVPGESLEELVRKLRDSDPDSYALLQEHLFVERHLDPRETGK